MSTIKIELDSVEVTDGQGAGEGAFELNIRVLKLMTLAGHVEKVIWPSLNGTPGTLGQDEVGQQSMTFELTSDMSKATKSVLVNSRNNGRNEGQVKVTLTAQEVLN